MFAFCGPRYRYGQRRPRPNGERAWPVDSRQMANKRGVLSCDRLRKTVIY